MSQPAKTYAPGKCAWCSGTGKVNVAPGMPVSCIVCGGKSYTSVAQPAYHCGPCQGTGRRDKSSPCRTCAGTGWEHISSVTVS